MDSTSSVSIEQRARRKYEWARVRRALVGFSPTLLIVALVSLATHRPVAAAIFGAALFVTGVLILWYGRDVRRAVLPGFGLGLVPLALALCANHMHVCGDGVCLNWCVPACVTGGLAAGIGTALIGHRTRRSAGYWGAAAVLTLLTGAMGCSCVGYSGVIGLAVGYAAGLVLSLVRRRAVP
jgi:hypothetical protein